MDIPGLGQEDRVMHPTWNNEHIQSRDPFNRPAARTGLRKWLILIKLNTNSRTNTTQWSGANRRVGRVWRQFESFDGEEESLHETSPKGLCEGVGKEWWRRGSRWWRWLGWPRARVSCYSDSVLGLLLMALKETNCQVLPLVLQYLNRSNSASVVDSIIPSRRTVVAGTKDRHATIVAPVAIGINSSSSSSRSNSRVAGDSRNFEKKTLLYRFFFDIIETAKITALCKNDEKMRKMFKTIISIENGTNNRRSPRSADNAAVVDFNCDWAIVGRHWHHRFARSRPLRLWHCAPLIGHCQSSWVSLPLFWKTKIEAIHL